MSETDNIPAGIPAKECSLEAPAGACEAAMPAVAPAPVLWLVVPCYNEEAVLPLTLPRFANALDELVASGAIHADSKACFVDDGSVDATWRIIQEAAAGAAADTAAGAATDRAAAADFAMGAPSTPATRVCGISLSRNQGHQNALLAGLMEARRYADIVISLDADGQDGFQVIGRMVALYAQGYDVVYGVRANRAADAPMKRATAQFYYKWLERMGVETVYNHADCRLTSRRVLDHLADFHEVNLYLRGLVPLVGFKSTTVEYEREARMAGKTKYPVRRMMSLAINGVTSLTVAPIRAVTAAGLLFGLIGLIGVVYALVMLVAGNTVVGWTSLFVLVCLLGGLQLVGIGIIGEYVGKMYLETKARPRYIIEERTWE